MNFVDIFPLRCKHDRSLPFFLPWWHIQKGTGTYTSGITRLDNASGHKSTRFWCVVHDKHITRSIQPNSCTKSILYSGDNSIVGLDKIFSVYLPVKMPRKLQISKLAIAQKDKPLFKWDEIDGIKVYENVRWYNLHLLYTFQAFSSSISSILFCFSLGQKKSGKLSSWANDDYVLFLFCWKIENHVVELLHEVDDFSSAHTKKYYFLTPLFYKWNGRWVIWKISISSKHSIFQAHQAYRNSFWLPLFPLLFTLLLVFV